MCHTKIEPIADYSLFVSENHTFGTDALLLSNFAACKFSKKAVDLGTGCGIIPLFLTNEKKVQFIYGVEIQQEGFDLCKKTVEFNHLEDKFEPVLCDLKALKGVVPFGENDLVTCNPPYKKGGAGIINESESQTIARHETLCTFGDIAKTAASLLKFGGRFCVCHRPERLTDIFAEMRNNGIEPKIFREVIQRKGKEPWLILVEGKRGAKNGLKILPPLYIEENGEYSAEMNEICKEYRKGINRK